MAQTKVQTSCYRRLWEPLEDERSKKEEEEEKGVLVFRWPRRQLSLIFEARSPKKTFRGILVSQFMRFSLILLHHEIIQLYRIVYMAFGDT